MATKHILENRTTPLELGGNGSELNMKLSGFKKLINLKRISNSTQLSYFARKMEKRVLKVKEVCGMFHETYNGRYV